MKKLYTGVLTMCTVLGVSAQDVVWQKDIKSSTQDFLSQVTTTIDQQYLITGSSIQAGTLREPQGTGDSSINSGSSASKQHNGYDFHLVKLNQQGEKVWEKYFSGKNQGAYLVVKTDTNKTANAKLIKK
ncbi:hypothetical protein [Chryseobacterium populi]|uniref:Uncharacterized protein n=1 Tax=Chryseobacterium populi TaxID=1144316 RepID=J2KNY8_9FLAO|nr:hypothetical protein [Chryseobacterium populi]EJL74788.1 hypothetical protein PMI13_00667 [Chryseobacterium populi]